MRKAQKVLIGVFLTGILLGGIGAGVAIGEYASMTYTGEKLLGEERMITENFDYAFDPELGDIGILPIWYDGRCAETIELDASVPEKVVRYEVTYSPELVDVELVLQQEGEAWEEDDEKNSSDSRQIQGDLLLEKWYSEEEEIWLREKDAILNELKHRRFASWKVRSISEIAIKVNPASGQYVFVR